ncbi:hypothetical protein [Nitrosarchaeum sp.]|uniref:hypothetical protein n=1 Tax=Nitrosarchaeum sp. TaxID=2026886 RepID=UPI00261ECE56|nr:hypothetical protein [Nitrosarchaeum sp.]
MNINVELNSISMSKNNPKNTVFHKYDVEASIDEVENTETHSVFKYGFTILSNPKNVRLAIEGVTKISGDLKELDDILSKDENDVPKILSTIYQELFPTFFLLSKSLNVSCPPIQIGGMGAGNIGSENTVSETNDVIENTNEMTGDSTSTEMTNESELENPDIAQPNI